MNAQQQRFFEKSEALYTCARCGTINRVTFRDVGHSLHCRGCGLVFHINNTVITDEDNADLSSALDEYLQEKAAI